MTSKRRRLESLFVLRSRSRRATNCVERLGMCFFAHFSDNAGGAFNANAVANQFTALTCTLTADTRANYFNPTYLGLFADAIEGTGTDAEKQVQRTNDCRSKCSSVVGCAAVALAIVPNPGATPPTPLNRCFYFGATVNDPVINIPTGFTLVTFSFKGTKGKLSY